MRIKLPPRPRLINALDDVVSLIVRKIWIEKTGGLCPFGCGRPIECAFHFIKKSRSLKVRFDFRNVIGACSPCNGYMEVAPAKFFSWYANTFGAEQLAQIEQESHGRAGWSRTDLAEMLAKFREQWAGMED
jgi:hypothetical protein